MAVGVFWSTVFLAEGVDWSNELAKSARLEVRVLQYLRRKQSGVEAYSEGQRMCSRWYCRRMRERGRHAQRWHRFR